MSLDQGTCLASKLPSGYRPDNALSRLRSPPQGGGLIVDGVYIELVLKIKIYCNHANFEISMAL